jgi:hypothetical protein
LSSEPTLGIGGVRCGGRVSVEGVASAVEESGAEESGWVGSEVDSESGKREMYFSVLLVELAGGHVSGNER